MHLQQQVQFDGQDIIGCDENLQMFKSILCFMAMYLTNTVPFVIKAIPILKLSSENQYFFIQLSDEYVSN